jgi:tripartite-type tricarboxylate transporter receptor subunit TctC
MTSTTSHIDRRAVLAGAGALVAAAPLAHAQAAQTSLVVPFPPGGSTDALARLMQAGLQERLKRNVLVENKPGAAGAIGAQTVAKAAADGSSLLVTFDSHAVIPAILEKPPVDVEKELRSILLVGTAPYVVAMNPSRPFKTFADAVAAAKDKPGSVKYASVGIGTIGHLAMTVLSKRAGVEITHVPYRGGGPAVNDAVAGHVDMVVGSVALVLSQIQGGTLKPLMQMGRTRLAALADTQTTIEAGFTDFEALAWWGIFAPKAMTDAMAAEMSGHVKATLADPVASKRLIETQQVDLKLGGPAEMDKFLADQIAFWGKVVRENNIKSTG